jgi:hypothetical protein
VLWVRRCELCGTEMQCRLYRELGLTFHCFNCLDCIPCENRMPLRTVGKRGLAASEQPTFSGPLDGGKWPERVSRRDKSTFVVHVPVDKSSRAPPGVQETWHLEGTDLHMGKDSLVYVSRPRTCWNCLADGLRRCGGPPCLEICC